MKNVKGNFNQSRIGFRFIGIEEAHSTHKNPGNMGVKSIKFQVTDAEGRVHDQLQKPDAVLKRYLGIRNKAQVSEQQKKEFVKALDAAAEQGLLPKNTNFKPAMGAQNA